MYYIKVSAIYIHIYMCVESMYILYNRSVVYIIINKTMEAMLL